MIFVPLRKLQALHKGCMLLASLAPPLETGMI